MFASSIIVSTYVLAAPEIIAETKATAFWPKNSPREAAPTQE
jgi:hypothetical protein